MAENGTEAFGFSVIEITADTFDGLKSLVEQGHKIVIQDVMNNGSLQGVVTPGLDDNIDYL